ncbi:unnamed protein product [Arctia plantaginis]|uniref:Uncharacterized protein n=1 Tax=Arctia plantaginis TaxID=874455 RepID=A0A8S0Z4S7_ARCPL|nr:unnamed protein product [Arctia plantaginis]
MPKNISRRSSFMIPGEDDEDSEGGSPTTVQTLDTRKLVQDISRKLKKNLQGRIKQSGKLTRILSTMEKALKNQETTIKTLQNKNEDLKNKNKNLELRVAVLEDGQKAIEQNPYHLSWR